MVRRVLSRLSVVMTLSALFTAPPQLAQAIPSSGDYVITGVNLTGTFTVSGTDLTVYDITVGDGPITFTSVNSLDIYGFRQDVNDSTTILMNQGNDHYHLDLIWAIHSVWDFDRCDTLDPDSCLLGNPGISPSLRFEKLSSVPEPPTAMLLFAGMGLLGLVEYVRRQRRQPGPQVG